MKVVILCGGQGSRLQEETERIPKPMVEIGGKPILWHIMKIYSHYGFKKFILCLGWKQNVVREYFHHYSINNSTVAFDTRSELPLWIERSKEDWHVTLVDTGENTATGGRLKRVEKLLGEETFMLTYGDGLSDVDISVLWQFHIRHAVVGEIATLTAVPSVGRFGAIEVGEFDHVSKFVEKPDGSHLINGGFFVMEPRVFAYLKDDQTDLPDALKKLSEEGRLVVYQHTGYWKCMDTLKDKKELEAEWQTGRARWKVWGE